MVARLLCTSNQNPRMISDYSAVGSQRGEKARGTHLSFDEFSSLPSPARAHAKAAECPGFKPLHIQWINGLLLFLWARRDSGDAQAQNGMMGEREEEAAGSGPSHSDLAVPFFFCYVFFLLHTHPRRSRTHTRTRARATPLARTQPRTLTHKKGKRHSVSNCAVHALHAVPPPPGAGRPPLRRDRVGRAAIPLDQHLGEQGLLFLRDWREGGARGKWMSKRLERAQGSRKQRALPPAPAPAPAPAQLTTSPRSASRRASSYHRRTASLTTALSGVVSWRRVAGEVAAAPPAADGCTPAAAATLAPPLVGGTPPLASGVAVAMVVLR